MSRYILLALFGLTFSFPIEAELGDHTKKSTRTGNRWFPNQAQEPETIKEMEQALDTLRSELKHNKAVMKALQEQIKQNRPAPDLVKTARERRLKGLKKRTKELEWKIRKLNIERLKKELFSTEFLIGAVQNELDSLREKQGSKLQQEIVERRLRKAEDKKASLKAQLKALVGDPGGGESIGSKRDYIRNKSQWSASPVVSPGAKKTKKSDYNGIFRPIYRRDRLVPRETGGSK